MMLLGITLLVLAGLTACSSQPEVKSNSSVLQLQAMPASAQADNSLPAKANASLPANNAQSSDATAIPQPAPVDPVLEAQQPAAVQADPLPTAIPVLPPAQPSPTPAEPAPAPQPAPAQNLLPPDQLPSVAPTKGHLAPDFTLQTIDGTSIHLADLRGQPVIVNYWSTWCIPCQEELPALEQLRAEFQGSGITILSINAIEQDTMEDVQQTIAQHGLTHPILLDKGAAFYDAYNVLFFPTSFFIDANGIITEVLLGGATQDEFRQRIQRLLSGG
jgi:peroxiredoxin